MIRSWKLPGELTQDEMNEALKALERRDYCPPFGEGYCRGDAACLIDFWLGTWREGHLYHFQAALHCLTDSNWDSVHGMSDSRSLFEIGRKEFGSVRDIGRYEEDGPTIAMFVVVGQFVQKGQLVNIGTVPTVDTTLYSLLWLKPLNKAAMTWVELVPRPSLIDPFVLSVSKRELDSAGIARCATGVGARCLPGELVEGRSVSTGDIRNRIDEVLSEFKQIRQFSNAKAVASSLHVTIGPEYCTVVWVGERIGDVCFQSGKVTMTPLKLADGGCKERVSLES